MRKLKRNLRIKVLTSLLGFALIPIVSIAPVNAVTFGTDISDPATDAPFVVSIWTSETNDARDAQFICSGSLIAPKIVLTAAHCTTETTPYFVKVKSPALNSNVDFVTVSGVWTNPRYNPKTFVNDIGLLKLDESFEGMPFPSLANSESARSINKFSRLRIYGWGLDQDFNQPDLLKTADLLLQDSNAAKVFGKTFNIKTMLAAGKKIVSEGVWSGGCSGDSGGPLISNINGIDVIVGVTSWGSSKCLPDKPTIFNRVSYYFNDIKSGIKAVEASSVAVNRTAPVATTDPSITGDAIPGQTLKCNPGAWKNALTVQASWISPTRLIGSSNLNIQVLPTDGGSEFKCKVTAASQSASVTRNLTKVIIGKASLRSNPVISGVNSGPTFKNGQVARCEGWNWTNPVDSERVTWFTSSTNNPSTPVNGRQIGSGNTITFTPELLKNERGRYLICQVTGVKDGFESHFVTSQFIQTPNAPVLNPVSLNYYSLADGSSVSCSYSKPYDADEIKVEWGSYTGNYFSTIPWLSGDRISINKAVIQSAAGKSIACRVTASNLGGESSRTSYSQDTFENLPSIPTVSISTSRSTPISGDYANCFASNTGAYMNTVSYQWGLTRSPSTNTFEGGVLGTSSTFYFTNANLVQLSGAFLTCVVSVTNGAGTTFGTASVNIAAQNINLPTPNVFTVASLVANNVTVAATVDIPTISNFNSSTMQAKLTITGSPYCVDRNVDPGVRYECAGLSPNTTYSGYISVVAISGNGIPTRSTTYSFTTSGLTGQPVYICGQSCTGSLSQTNMQYYLSDKRLVEASSAPGGPITSSTCLGSGCNSGTAPALPVACGSGSTEKTSLVANATALITTAFRYCSAPLDTTAPTIVDASATYTGYAKIIPTSGAAGTSIAVRFVARDNIGIASTQVRLVNPQNVVVSTVNGTFQVGSTSDGGYIANISTASSGPMSGDVYQIQVQASDAAGNTSAWFSLGTFLVSSSTNLPIPNAPTFTPISNTKVRVTLPGIAGFDPNTMSASLNIYWQTSLTSVGIDGAAGTLDVNANEGKTHTGYILVRRKSDGLEVKSTVITFVMPSGSLSTTTAIIPTTKLPTASEIWTWSQVLVCQVNTNKSATTTFSWVVYPNSNYLASERRILATNINSFTLDGDNLSYARGKYFGCESSSISGTESFTSRDMYPVNANAAILNTALRATWSPLKLSGTNYTVTVNASKGTSPRDISKVLIGYNSDCETIYPCTATNLTLTLGTTNSGTWTGSINPGKVLGDEESLTIYIYDTDNRIMAIAPRINQWGVTVIAPTLVTGSTIQTSDGGVATYFAQTSHFYRYVSGYKTFSDARSYASNSQANGKTGYLVTITSSAENTFIQNNIGMSASWIGASDAASEGCWRWVNGTAADMATPFFAAPNSTNCGGASGYSNWMSGEPNDFNGNEDHALIGPTGIWNDFTDGIQNLNAPVGFIIEYGD